MEAGQPGMTVENLVGAAAGHSELDSRYNRPQDGSRLPGIGGIWQT